MCITHTLRNLEIQANKLTTYFNWAALQVSGNNTKVTSILHKAKATGIYGADPSTQPRAQLKDKIKVQGQYTQFIKFTDPFMYLGIALTMSLDWSHQQKKMTKNLTNKLNNKLNKSYASPFQTNNIINTAIIPSIAYAFPVVPCTPNLLNTWDQKISRSCCCC
jgi:hypothetical protein